MAIKKSGSKSLADQLADLEDPTPKGLLRSLSCQRKKLRASTNTLAKILTRRIQIVEIWTVRMNPALGQMRMPGENITRALGK